jgi:hypothetical protein
MTRCPAGTFARAYEANRKAAVADAVDADPVAACAREMMAERSAWMGSAADVLPTGADVLQGEAAAGPKIPVRWQAACVAHRHRCVLRDWL